MILSVFGRFCCLLCLFCQIFGSIPSTAGPCCSTTATIHGTRFESPRLGRALRRAFTVSRWAFVAPNVNTQGLRQSSTALAARGGGEYDISDADIQNFYNSLLTLGLVVACSFTTLKALGSMHL